MNYAVLCVSKAVFCAVTAITPCKSPLKHGQMQGKLLYEKGSYYLADFSEASEFKGLDGDYSKVLISKRQCVKIHEQE